MPVSCFTFLFIFVFISCRFICPLLVFYIIDGVKELCSFFSLVLEWDFYWLG